MTREGGNGTTIDAKALEVSEFGSEISKFFLEFFPPENGEGRKAWFFRLSLAVGIKAGRLKDLFYDTRCRMSAVELAKIQQKRRVCIERQISELQRRQSVLAARLRSTLGENIHEDRPHHRGARCRDDRLSIPDPGRGAHVHR